MNILIYVCLLVHRNMYFYLGVESEYSLYLHLLTQLFSKFNLTPAVHMSPWLPYILANIRQSFSLLAFW